jgi:glycosyltransferase involved in cell wall biosynthesis
MEAAAMGLPIIATDVRGCRQVVLPGRTGVLVPPRDPERLASAIEALVDDAGERARLGAAAALDARARFDQQIVIDRTLATYERLRASVTARPSSS